MNIQFLAVILRRLVQRRLSDLENWSPGEWSYVCTLSGEERKGRADILEVVRTNNPESETAQSYLPWQHLTLYFCRMGKLGKPMWRN